MATAIERCSAGGRVRLEMAKRRLNNWRWWLQSLSFALLLFAFLAPLSETPRKILTALAVAGNLILLLTDSPDSRREMARILIPLAAVVLLAVLFSFNPKWILFGSLGVYIMWGLFSLEHAEYLAEQELPQEPPASKA